MKIVEITGNYRYKLMISIYKKWINTNDSILDVGCGTGVIIKFLMHDFSVNIVGCDIKNYLIYKIPFLEMKDNKIPTKDSTYDLALLNDVLHHVPKSQQMALLQEVMRVAKKILIFEAEPTVAGKIADIILNTYHYEDLKTPLSFRTMKEWKKIFTSLSLKSKTVKLKKPFWYPFSHIAFMIYR